MVADHYFVQLIVADLPAVVQPIFAGTLVDSIVWSPHKQPRPQPSALHTTQAFTFGCSTATLGWKAIASCPDWQEDPGYTFLQKGLGSQEQEPMLRCLSVPHWPMGPQAKHPHELQKLTFPSLLLPQLHNGRARGGSQHCKPHSPKGQVTFGFPRLPHHGLPLHFEL